MDCKDEQWFGGSIQRIECEKLLKKDGIQHGQFILRESGSGGGQFTITARVNRGIKHFRIAREDGGSYYIASGVTFPSIFSLVHNYMNEDISSEGVLIRLKSYRVNGGARNDNAPPQMQLPGLAMYSKEEQERQHKQEVQQRMMRRASSAHNHKPKSKRGPQPPPPNASKMATTKTFDINDLCDGVESADIDDEEF